MRRAVMIALVVALGSAGATAAGSRHHQAILRRLCSLTHPCNQCPAGQWMCAGKCIPNGDACRAF